MFCGSAGFCFFDIFGSVVVYSQLSSPGDSGFHNDLIQRFTKAPVEIVFPSFLQVPEGSDVMGLWPQAKRHSLSGAEATRPGAEKNGLRWSESETFSDGPGAAAKVLTPDDRDGSGKAFEKH